MSNDHYGWKKEKINLLNSKENGDSHVIMSSQACFLPIIRSEETKFNVALYNYQSQPKNPAVLVIVSTAKGASAQIIEGREQYLLFNHNGKKADFVGERVSDVRKKKGQKNVNDKKLSKKEKQDNVIVIVQIPLKQKQIAYNAMCYEENESESDYSSGSDDEECDDDDDDDDDDEKCNVEAAIVKVANRTKPVCICGKELQKYQVQYVYNGKGVRCNECRKSINGAEEIVYHCPDNKNNYQHPNGYDLCVECAEKQLKFDELRGLLDDDKSYILKRNEDYPIRVTLQYYKATSNGVVNKEVMDDIVKQLESSQKQADFIGSLVTEYNKNRPSEWINNDEVKIDEYKEIRNALKEHCGNDWKIYMKNFENEEVTDTDLDGITSDDLKELINKMGPRNRFKKWMDSRK